MAIEVNYVTSSLFKREEIQTLLSRTTIAGQQADRVFDFHVLSLSIKEHLEIDIQTMVMAEVTYAYSQLKVPCIVEHAGLIFEKYEDRGYPGGLTKPMWDTLGADFISETNSAGVRAAALACVAYCDGQQVQTFTGRTTGQIAPEPRGSRDFYWDTVFIPDREESPTGGLTYAEIVDAEGLEAKMDLSQSAKAMTAFLEYRLDHQPELWPAS